MIDIEGLKTEFLEINGEADEDVHVYFAPGRVNLIGEHTDYNNGYVLPFGLQYGTYLVTRRCSDPLVRFKSKNFPMNAQVCLKKEITPIGDTWVNYPLGVVREFIKLGFNMGGMELLYEGDIPNEAGLSSSASIEVVTAFAINELFECGLDKLQLIHLAQRAENDFVGMQCGIMDQFAVTMGGSDKAVFLDCGSLDYQMVPFETGEYRIVICNTNKKRGLAGSKYNERRAECEKAVGLIQAKKEISSLGELTVKDFIRVEYLIDDPVIRKRARHVVTENDRVTQAVSALRMADLEKLGKLMTESHLSLSEDYEVSCVELDEMVNLANNHSGVLGARMTGAGFGGCAICLIHSSEIETFISAVGKKYKERTGYEGDFYEAVPGEGVREIK